MQTSIGIGIGKMSGGGWNPSALSSTRIWLDTTDGTTITTATGVSSWANKADTSLLASVDQATGSAQPTLTTLNGQQAFRSTAAQWLAAASFSAALSQPNTIAVVFQIVSVSGAHNVVTGAVGTENRIYFQSADPSTAVGYAGSFLSATSSLTHADPHVVLVEFNGASSNIYVDGTLEAPGSTGAQTLDGLAVGASVIGGSGANITHGDVVVCDALLSASDRAQLTNWLRAKWSTP